jgi:hypothetical protein
MSPEQAAMIIQGAWRAFVDDIHVKAHEAHIADLNATYYRQCYAPVDNYVDDYYYDCNTGKMVKW